MGFDTIENYRSTSLTLIFKVICYRQNTVKYYYSSQQRIPPLHVTIQSNEKIENKHLENYCDSMLSNNAVGFCTELLVQCGLNAPIAFKVVPLPGGS